jgi:proteasome lid subunit RPN8/RPN11
MGMEIEVTRAALEAIRAAAERALPEEACGLLFGRDRLVERAIPARNVHPAPQRRFEIDPQALIDAHRAARQGGPEVVGYYHSHPAGPAKPSAADREMAAGDGSIWAIAAAGDVTFWRDDEDGFVALSYIADDG